MIIPFVFLKFSCNRIQDIVRYIFSTLCTSKKSKQANIVNRVSIIVNRQVTPISLIPRTGFRWLSNQNEV